MENYVIIEGVKYTESTLRLMNEVQLNELIKKCQAGIDEIALKEEDYKNTNYDNSNMEHYYEVIRKFEAASVYLQSDIVLISKIIKTKANTESVCDRNNWFECFFSITSSVITKRKLKKIINETNKSLGYSIKL